MVLPFLQPGLGPLIQQDLGATRTLVEPIIHSQGEIVLVYFNLPGQMNPGYVVRLMTRNQFNLNPFNAAAIILDDNGYVNKIAIAHWINWERRGRSPMIPMVQVPGVVPLDDTDTMLICQMMRNYLFAREIRDDLFQNDSMEHLMSNLARLDVGVIGPALYDLLNALPTSTSGVHDNGGVALKRLLAMKAWFLKKEGDGDVFVELESLAWGGIVTEEGRKLDRYYQSVTYRGGLSGLQDFKAEFISYATLQ